MTSPTNNRRLARVVLLWILLARIAPFPSIHTASAQTRLGTVHGRVTDVSGALVPGVEVEVKSAETNEEARGATDNQGLYAIPALRPGRYGLVARKSGFKAATVKQFTLNVGEDHLRNITFEVGDVTKSITVSADVEKLDTTDGSVGTVVDRETVENLLLNGRSFQSLLELTPGVGPAVPGRVSGHVNQQGQFTVNRQRGDANYFMVDGVSANTGSSLGAALGQSGAGAPPNTTAFGGCNGVVSLDALQEFRVTTSSFAPEYGHTPGGQVSFVTRSRTNSHHAAFSTLSAMPL